MRNPSISYDYQATNPVRDTLPRSRPLRFVALTLLIMVSIAAGTTLGASLYRVEWRSPIALAPAEKTDKEIIVSGIEKPRTERLKTVIAVKTHAVNPLPQTLEPNQTPIVQASAERFGTGDNTEQVAQAETLVQRLRDNAPVDGAQTGSITSGAQPVDVAESEAQTIELEEKLSQQDEQNFNVDEPSAASQVPSHNGVELLNRQTAKYVNLRAGPDNEADVLAIVPAKTQLLAENNCTHWCAAIYQGQKGYIYKSFFLKELR